MVQQAVKVIPNQENTLALQQSVSSFEILLKQQNFPTDITQKVLNCLSNGTEINKVFRRKPFVEQSKKLSEVIHKVKLAPLTNKFIITDMFCEKPKQKKCLKEIAASQRKIDIAKGDKLRGILTYDVMECNMLYDGDVMTKLEQSQIIAEIQNILPEQSTLHDLGGTNMDNTCVIIDFMAVVRLIKKNNFLPKSLKICLTMSFIMQKE